MRINVICNMKLGKITLLTIVSSLLSSCFLFYHPYSQNEIDQMITADSVASIMAQESTISVSDSNSDTIAAANIQMVGNDRDEHGCIGSAGYVWSNVLNRCVRLFDEGIGFRPTGKLALQENTDEYGTILLGYVIFGGADSMYAELFFPHVPTKIICHRTGSQNNTSVWKSENYEVHKITEHHYFITHLGDIIYSRE